MKSQKDTNILKRILIALYIIIFLGILLLIVNVIQIGNNSKNTIDDSQTETDSYDVSAFNKVSTKEVLDLFDKKGYSIVVFGSNTCGYCKEFVKIVKQAQDKLNFTHYYGDVDSMDKNSDDYKALMKKFDKKTTMKINGEEKTGTYGEFFIVTPITIIIKDGKMVDGFIGYGNYDTYIELLNDNGIK